MKHNMILFSLMATWIFGPGPALANGDLTNQRPITKTVQLGNKNNSLAFYPAHLRFETGKLYKLVIKNPSEQKHYFTSAGLAQAVFTRKVQVVNTAGKTVAEIKGWVSEIEVYPGGITEWWFVPVKTLRDSSLYCSIKGHREAGMTGLINIE